MVMSDLIRNGDFLNLHFQVRHVHEHDSRRALTVDVGKNANARRAAVHCCTMHNTII